MTATDHQPRARLVRILAAGAAVAVGTAAVGFAAAAPAGATSAPLAQSVGRFLDGEAGGKPIQTLVDLKDARATAPGHPSQQNPMQAKLLGQATVPLGHHLQLPGKGVFKLGAVNQVAVARNGGYAYGASGAVSNSGGISSGGKNHKYPADAQIDLSSKKLGSVPIPAIPKNPLPGLPGGHVPALGGISVDVGAISALAKTNAGGSFASPQYKIASLTLSLKSPALAALLKRLANGGKQLKPILKQIYAALKTLDVPVPPSCQLNPSALPATISLDHGAVVIDPSTGSITVDIAKLLQTLGANLNALPPNTDLLAYVLNNLGKILSFGLANVINGLINPIKALGQNCVNDITNAVPPPLDQPLKSLLKQLTSGQSKLENALEAIAAQLSSAAAPGLKQLTDNLAKAIAIGVNVQQGAYPLAGAPAPTYRFYSALVPTPDQATPMVIGQGVVRAIEIKVANGQGASLALGNAAAGPSSKPSPTTPQPPAPSTAIPTGVPAGNAASSGGNSPLPLVILLVVLALGGVGSFAYRARGRFSR
jgi:hypothetical protein